MSKYTIGFLFVVLCGAGFLSIETSAQRNLAHTNFETSLVRESNSQDQTSPEATLAAFYDAINNKDYARAFSTWETPPTDLQNMSRGYADTVSVRLFVGLPVSIEGAAGSSFANVPTILASKLRNGRERIYAGCYTMRKSNLTVQDNPNAQGWRIYKSDISLVPENASFQTILDRLCKK